MGGKQKQAQRTKNNARPSSSSRSAEKLGANIPSFVGFSADHDGGYITVLPGFSSSENFESNIDPNIQIIFRKMNKKDPVTKLKALNEFTTFVNFSDEATVCTTLSFWPRLYSQLSADCNHRVREAAQIAHAAIVSKCGRSVAPYLKQIVPVWIASQFDIYMPAKSQARESFEKMFPKSKVSDVMAFCRKEIINFISDNLILHTPTTLSNPKIFSQEECESIYERTVIMSLNAYEFFILNLPEDHYEWLCTNQINILDSNKFWDFGKNKTPQIRSSCFAVIGCLNRKVTSWFNPKYGAKALAMIFNKFIEKDTDVIVALLENCILLMANMPGWHENVDVVNKFLPSAFAMLAEGGYNNATEVGPLMLPLLMQLSNFPGKNNEFYNDFFNSVCKGLEQRCIVSSKMGYDAWLTGLVECLEFVAKIEIENDQGAQILSQPLRAWLNTTMLPKIPNNSFNYVKLSSSHLAKVSIAWTKQSVSGSTSKNMLFSQLIRLFWKNFLYVIDTQVNNMKAEEIDIKKITDIHIELLIGLKIANSKKKRIARVKFDVDQNDDGCSSKTDNDKLQVDVENNIDALTVQNYQHNLNKTAYDTCAKYLVFAKQNNISMPILSPLFSLIREFNALELHDTMLNSIISKEQAVKTINIYTNCYADWLKGDSMRSPVVVDLTFALLIHLNYDDQLCILKSFDQLPISVIKWCISRCISHPYSTCPAVYDWLQSDTVHQTLVAISKLVIKEGDKNHMELLKMCFMQSDSGGLLIRKSTYSEIVTIFEQSLYNVDSDHLNMCASFASHLLSMSNAITQESYDIYSRLLISLFTLDCNSQKIQNVIPQDTMLEINTSWRDALSSLSQKDLTCFIENVSNVVHAKLSTNEDISAHLQIIDTLVDSSFNLICSCMNIDASEEEKIDILNKLVSQLLSNKSNSMITNMKKLHQMSLVADLSSGRFNCALLTDSLSIKEVAEKDTADEIKDLELNTVLPWLLFLSKIIEKFIIMLNKPKQTDEIDHFEIDENILNDQLIDDALHVEIQQIVTELLHNVTIVKTIYSHYKMYEWYNQLSKFFEPMEKIVISIVKNMKKESFDTIYSALKAKADEEGFYWAYCLHIYGDVLKEHTEKIDSKSKVNKAICTAIENFSNTNDPNDFLNLQFCHYIQIIKNEEKDLESNICMKIAGIITTRQLYHNYLSVHGLTVDDLKNALTSPVANLTVIIDAVYSSKLKFSEVDILKSSWSSLQFYSALVEFLTCCVQNLGWEMQCHQWDFITILLSSMIQSLTQSKNSWNSLKVSMLGCAVFNLFSAVSHFISTIIPESVRREPTKTVLQLLDEWRELFSPRIHNCIIEIFMKVCSDSITPEYQISTADPFFINEFVKALQKFDLKYFENNKDNHNIVDFLKPCLDIMACPSHYIFKYMAHTVLKILTPSLIDADKTQGNKVNLPNEEEAVIEPLILSVHSIENTLVQLESCMEAILAPYKVGDNCTLLPYSDGHSIAMGYLLIWEALLDIAQESTAYLQHGYSEFFKRGQFVDALLNVIFKLLPAELIEKPTSAATLNYFKTSPNFSLQEPITWELISWLTCQRLLHCLRGGWLGALVRSWWGSLPTKSSQYVEQIVQAHVSPILIADQLSAVIKNQNKIPNIEITIHNSVNEVLCIYIIEDLKMGLNIQLCSNHPLNKPLVVSSGTPINNMQWLSMYLSHQNGSVYQAIKMWANSVQKKIEATPVCYVCYCRLHPNTGQLPKMLCQTCKNKFHNVCLYRWFSTSGKTTCPMCRNTFAL